MSDFSVQGLDHIQLAMPAGGESEARAFYRDKLGLTEVEKPAVLAGRGGCWFTGTGVNLHLGVETSFAPARKAHPAFVVDDLRAAQQRLAGGEISELPGVRRFFTADPFGNRIEILQRN